MSEAAHAHSSALRLGRRSIPGQVYLITWTSRDRSPHFAGFDVAVCACRTLSEPRLWRDSRLLAWVLMPDHWHCVVELGAEESLSKLVGRAKAISTLAVKHALGDSHPVWQPGFHDRALRSDENLLAAVR